MPPPNTTTTLPRIACFHGGGSNSTIFEIQCSFLSNLLSSSLILEFFDGPFLRSAGPGVLPAFEECAPFKSWFEPLSLPGAPPNATNPDKNDGSGYDGAGRDGIERVLGLMEERGREKGFGDECWVGVMGFSQGTRVAGGILLDQQRREKLKRENAALARRAVGDGIRVNFGVLCNGGGVPMDSEVGFSTLPPLFFSLCFKAGSVLTGLELDNPDTVIRIPTLHVHGYKDEFLQYSRDQLATFYDRDTAELYEINYHHAMPWVKAESEELARRVKELYNRTRS